MTLKELNIAHGYCDHFYDQGWINHMDFISIKAAISALYEGDHDYAKRRIKWDFDTFRRDMAIKILAIIGKSI